MRYKFLTGDINWEKYGGKFISPRLNNGDWDYWLIIEVINWHDATGEENLPRYCVSISAVSPQAAGDKLKIALDSCDLNLSDYDEKYRELIAIEALAEYGIRAHLWEKRGNNIHKLLKEAKKQSDCIKGLFGFYMDSPQNRLGQDGWDVISGQDIRDFLESRKD